MDNQTALPPVSTAFRGQLVAVPDPDMPRADLPFARLAREGRERLGITYREMARRLGVSERTVRSFEAGEPCVKIVTIDAYHRVLGVPLHELVDVVLASMQVDALRRGRARVLRATPVYGQSHRWIVWTPGDDGRFEETTASSCTCRTFAERGACPCVALVRGLEADAEWDQAS